LTLSSSGRDMDAAALFQLSGPVALLGWIALICAPLRPNAGAGGFGRIAAWAERWVAGITVPALFSIAYAALMMTNWAEAPGGYGTLEEVMLLFSVPAFALAGWLHYLAFDLLVGGWIVRVARREGVSRLLVVPCLLLTFLFGPVGYILFSMLRAARKMTGQMTGQAHV
jgi:hypothetical protein